MRPDFDEGEAMGTAASAISGSSLRDRFGWRAERRPEPGFGHVLAAASGSFLVFAAMSLVAEIAGDDPTVPGVLFSLALIALGIIGGVLFSGPVRSACATILVLATPTLWFFLFLGDGEGGRGAVRAVYLLTIAVYVVLAAIVWTRGRGIMLAVLLIAFTSWVLFEVGGEQGGIAPFQDQLQSSESTPFPFDDSEVLDSGTDTSTETSVASLILGSLYLGAAWRLDRQGLRGIATPFIAVGAIFAILGAIALGNEESVIVGGLCAAAIGAVVGIIGGLGQDRRGTTWTGVLFIKLGLLAVASDITEDNLGLAGLFVLFAVGLAVIAFYSAKQFGEYIDGDEEAGKVTSVRPPPASSAPATTS
jgi:hypothetical protein